MPSQQKKNKRTATSKANIWPTSKFNAFALDTQRKLQQLQRRRCNSCSHQKSCPWPKKTHWLKMEKKGEKLAVETRSKGRRLR